ncbi:VanW family protein [Patescibacteria group bacterium]|nr:VanW family protein [Patescibacteria group bacterium]
MIFKNKSFSFFYYFLFVSVLLVAYLLFFQGIYQERIYPQVYFDNLNVGGLKKDEARIFLNLAVKKIEKEELSFLVKTEQGEERVSVPLSLIAVSDPDLSRQIVNFDIHQALTDALLVGRDRNLIKMVANKIKILFKPKVLKFPVDINRQELKEIIRSKLSFLEKPSQNADIIVKEGQIELQEETSGFVFDYEKALDDLILNLERLNNQEIVIEAIVDRPAIRAEEVQVAFARAQEIFNSSPYLLEYQDQEWICSPEKIGNWLIFSQKEKGRPGELFLDQEKVREYLEEIGKEINVAPRETRLEIIESDDQRRVSEFQAGKKGLQLNIEATQELITQTILKGEKNNILLQVEKVDPTPLPNNLNVLGINDLLAVGSSNFAGSPQNRRHNIRVGAEILHGLLISPDQEFSLVQALGEINKDSGFLPELVIKGDRTVPEYGGGLCQIGTTMFRLVLNTGLPVTERASHSYRVSYYEPAGLDATIYNPRPDFRFVNDTGRHLLLQTKIEGDDLIFEFYGTDDGRKVQGEGPEIYNIVQPGPPQFIETDELEPGKKRRIESAHAGAEAKYINTITFPNKITRRDVWVSRYQPWPEVWLVGREPEKDPESSLDPNLDLNLDSESQEG